MLVNFVIIGLKIGDNSSNGSNSDVDVLQGVTETVNCSSDISSELDVEIEFSDGDVTDSSCTTNLSIFEEFHEQVSSAFTTFSFHLVPD